MKGCLCEGERAAYFLGPVPQDKLPKADAPGNALIGSLKLGLLQGSKEHAPTVFPIFYRFPPYLFFAWRLLEGSKYYSPFPVQ